MSNNQSTATESVANVFEVSAEGASYRMLLPNADVDYIQRKLANEHAPYELPMLEDMCSRLSPGDLVVDAGANIGNHTMYLAAVAGCRVAAFEPNRALAGALRASLAMNGLQDKVAVREDALGKAAGKGHFAKEIPDNLGAQSIDGGEGPIEIRTLDSVGLDAPVKAIKIDVEGMELDVLEGAGELVLRDRPLVYVECATEASFRKVHQWMMAKNYGYWDTFNATPTHLFVPNEQTTVDQRLSRLQLKGAEDTYQLKQQIAKTREMLDSANLKYRASTEQVATLKVQLVQEEGARRDADKAAEQAVQQLAQVRDRLEGERGSLQREVLRLTAVAEAHRQGAHDAEKQLVRLEAAAQVSERERAVLVEQINRLSERESQAGKAAHEAEKKLIRVEVELKSASDTLAAANARHEDEQAQILALRQRLVQEEQAAKAAEKLWGESQAQLESLSGNLRAANERIAAEARARQGAEQQWEKSRTAFARAEAALQQANLKYRQVAGEEIPQLKARLEKGQAELNASKKALAEANRQLERARQQKMQAEQQVVKTRASLSFQLGYILIHGFKSPRAFFGIPGALGAWRKEVLKRRKQKDQQMQKLQAAAIPPAHQKAAAPQPLPRTASPAQAVASSAARTEQQKPGAGAPAPAAHAVSSVVAPKAWPTDLRQLKVACIMDEFTFGSYRAECQLLQLTPDGWHAELEGFKPELLFIESAWRGKDELWGSKVGHNSQEVQGIVAWCRQHGVPTVFWNKEDPVHFETFLNTAMLFDCVFTTDIDCIHRYKAALQHDNVFLLPFACQPKNNHPIETYERKDAFCFAGAYYVRYPERTRDLGNFVAELPSFRPLEIYDRNFGKNDPNYQFPPEYQPYIVGTLPFDQIDKAYKGYRYAINLNSIKQSQTMFARRVFELMASNTVTVSNFSRGIRLMFGDLVITTDSGSEMVRHLNEVAGDDTRSAKLRLAALRKVLQEHTYEQRLAYVFSKVSGQVAASTQPVIAVFARAGDQRELDLMLGNFERQRYAHARLTVMLDEGFAPAGKPADLRVSLLPQPQLARQTIGALAGKAAFVAGMVAQDYYGPHYLTDIALATTYSEAEVIGKHAYYAWESGAPVLKQAGTSYRPAGRFAARSSAVRSARVAGDGAAQWIASLADNVLDTGDGLAIDEFNYCRDGLAAGAAPEQVAAAADDLQGIDTGVPVEQLLRLAEGIAPAEDDGQAANMISGRELLGAFGRAPSAAVQMELDVDTWQVRSSLADGKHEYLYSTRDFALEELGWDGKAKFYFDTTPGLNLQLVLVFLDAQKQKISHAIKHANRNQETEIPLGTVAIRLGLRIYAGGSADIKGLVLGHRDLQPAEIIGKADRLVLTNHYPSYDDLYRNGFVHSRVVAYRERGIRCDVFRMRPNEPVSYHEFEDVDVTTGSQEVLNQMLSSGRYKTVMVHFLEPAMWEVLRHHIDRVKVVVWVHGAEIQPWHRRDYNYSNEEERTVAKMKSEARMTFWRGLLQPMPANLKLVFVSRYFAEEVMEDLGFRVPEEHYTIIHNPIDTDVFSYRAKPAGQRKKVLSIRPYASAKYANDLSVKAIELLSSEPWFGDMEFRMIGDGPLFEQTLAPLRQFSNVHIERRFLKQSEIADLHKEYGIFLSPTRMDAQGVSRDEAMASGLVPVTNGVTAIPEFVDDECGILAPGDDAVMMAKGIARLYEDPELFSAMSKAASARVERQSGKIKIVNAEIGVLE